MQAQGPNLEDRFPESLPSFTGIPLSAAATYTYSRPLTNLELLAHLRAEDRVVIKVPGLRWQLVEREIEQLGFGDQFVVSATNGKHGECCKIEPVRHTAPATPSSVV